MKAITIKEFGSPDTLHPNDIQKPQINDNQLLIRIISAAVNPVDAKIRSGKHISCKSLELPAVLGKDMSGIVEAVGKNVQGYKIGDAVFGCISKTYAEYTVADPQLIAKKPENISFDEAAAVSLAGITAYQAINEQLKAQAGQKVLIQSAAGGVGHLAVQFAKINGAYVSGTASGENRDLIMSLGVDQAINYKEEKFEDMVSDLDAVMDTMGGEILYRSIRCVKPGGRVVCLPSSTWDDPKAIALAKERGVEMVWFMMQPNKAVIDAIADLLKTSKLRVHVDKVYSPAEIKAAHEAIESHGVRGKIVVRFGSP